MDLYYMPESPPSRAVMMTAAAIGLELNLILTNVLKGEQKTPEFMKLNPQHCIPTLNDNGFVMWESRAIQLYLVEQYAKTDSLYPKDFEKRAIVNQLLNFDVGTLYQCFADYYYSQLLDKLPANPELFKEMTEAVNTFDKCLSGRVYAAMDTLTVADFSLLSTISTYDIAGFDLSKYANVKKWYERCKQTVPGYEANRAGAESFKKFFVNL